MRNAAPDDALGHYLVGRVLAASDANEDATRSLVTAARLGLDDPLLARENDRLLVATAYMAGDLETTREAARRLLAPDAPEVLRLEAQDWLDRVAFAEADPSFVPTPVRLPVTEPEETEELAPEGAAAPALPQDEAATSR